MVPELPAELWLLILHFAFDDDAVLAATLPSSWDLSSWVKSVDGKWTLRAAHENIGVVIRKRTASLKVFITISISQNWLTSFRLSYRLVDIFAS
jgi:hypothetical protein